MQLDDELCLCFHVTRRKLTQYVRVNRPSVVSQLSECGGAGTGCGWCRPYLRQIFERERIQTRDEAIAPPETELPSAEDYARSRAAYRQAKRISSDD